MFKILKNLFLGGPPTIDKPPEEPPKELHEKTMIELCTSEGEKVYIEKEDFIKNVLPHNLKECWDHPQQLCAMILAHLDEFSSALEPAALHQMTTDDNPERGHVIASIVLMRNQKYSQARQILDDYIKRYGKSAVVLTNLAKTYEDNEHAEIILEEALQLDPNFANGLDFWLAIRREKYGERGYENDLLHFSKTKHAWRAQLYLANLYLSQKNLERALPLIKAVLKTAPIESDALLSLSGALGQNGYEKELIAFIEKKFDFKGADSLGILQNILQAYYNLGKPDEGLTLIHETRNIAPLTLGFGKVNLEHILQGYENMFKSMANDPAS